MWVLDHNPSLISMPSSLHTCTSGMFPANLSPHFPKIIFVSAQYLALIFSAIALMLSQTDQSSSTAKKTWSTPLIESTTFILNYWSWKTSDFQVFNFACSSLFTITQSSSPSSLQSCKHSICPGWTGLKYHEVITIVFIILSIN